tara:strand:- start:201 stop:545 length:345 start_codon:yes stop_codon:yes gene_type:complete
MAKRKKKETKRVFEDDDVLITQGAKCATLTRATPFTITLSIARDRKRLRRIRAGGFRGGSSSCCCSMFLWFLCGETDLVQKTALISPGTSRRGVEKSAHASRVILCRSSYGPRV